VICKKGFVPNARLGDRQRTCDEAKCRHELRLRNQATWRKAHPGYFIAWRAKERAERNAEDFCSGNIVETAPEPCRPVGVGCWVATAQRRAGRDFVLGVLAGHGAPRGIAAAHTAWRAEVAGRSRLGR
jgi:hypothetical protein